MSKNKGGAGGLSVGMDAPADLAGAWKNSLRMMIRRLPGRAMLESVSLSASPPSL
ncbi:MAG: hypothetical protein LBU32_00730 [Clostridiales bacterium]|jgi:hypothetical protein|nr:hypothetical protein [Clostridiales bacterium]